METIDTQLLDMETDIKNANVVKNITLAKLANDGIITAEQFKKYHDEIHIILVKKSWFKALYDKLTGDSSGYRYEIVEFKIN